MISISSTTANSDGSWKRVFNSEIKFGYSKLRLRLECLNRYFLMPSSYPSLQTDGNAAIHATCDVL